MKLLQVYARVEKGADQQLFVYSVEKCYARTSKDIANYNGPEDVFFDNQCPLDETMDFAVTGGNLVSLYIP